MSPCKDKINFRTVKGQTELVMRPAVRRLKGQYRGVWAYPWNAFRCDL